MEKDMFELLIQQKQKQEIAAIIEINQKTRQFGLVLTEDEAYELMVSRNNSLKKYQRVEFGESILEKLIFVFCDSDFINQDQYRETLSRLQDIFYEFKNEAEDMLTDDELMIFMREQFDDVCFGDLDYLEGTCLERFAEAVRAGYRGYQQSGGRGEYSQFDNVTRWDRNLYLEALKELFWE